MGNKQIYITGMGAVTPIGIGVCSYWQGLVSGACGISDIPLWDDMDAVPVKRAAQILGFNAREHLPMRLVQDMEPYMQFAYIAAEEAVKQSGLCTESDRIGIVMGTALCGIDVIGDTAKQLALKHRQAGPKFLTKAMGNIAAAQFAISHGIHGPSLTVSTACSSGGDAITTACLLLRADMADAVIVMAGESAICPTLIQSLAKTGALSKTGESLPFDVSRNGFVLGEGGGALVLESRAYSERRGAQPIARLLGCANNTDAFNPVSPEPGGRGAAACMRLALSDAGIAPEQVDYINAHGTATVVGDMAEANAVHQVFGDRPVAISSTKGATGHMMGAGGITELISCIKAIETGLLPVNLGLTHADPACRLNIVTEQNNQRQARIAMSNALGFGGQNSCILVGGI